MLSDQEIKYFDLNGALKVALPDDIGSLQSDFIAELEEYLAFYHPNLKSNDVQHKLVELAELDRSEVGKLYKVVRRFPSMRRLSCSDWAVSLAKVLMRSNLISCCNFVAARFDLPRESKYATAPHQDFPYIQGSLDGITIWVPFVNVPYEVGAPSYVPGSHKNGPSMVKEHGINKENGTSSVESVDLEKWKDLSYTKTEIQNNECLIMHTLLIHRSEPNLSSYARISTQLRFDNLTDFHSYNSGYSDGLYLSEHLSKYYPNLVKNQ
jgi:hypothetical protein